MRNVGPIDEICCNGHCLDLVKCFNTGNRKYRFICKKCRFSKCQQLMKEINSKCLLPIDQQFLHPVHLVTTTNRETLLLKLSKMSKAIRTFEFEMRNSPLSKYEPGPIQPFELGSPHLKRIVDAKLSEHFSQSALSVLDFLTKIPEFRGLSIHDQAILTPFIAHRLFTISDLLFGNGFRFNCTESGISTLFTVYPKSEALIVSRTIAKQIVSDWRPNQTEIIASIFCTIFHCKCLIILSISKLIISSSQHLLLPIWKMLNWCNNWG